MREIKFYRTYSLGGMEGRTKEIRNFETVKLAVEDAVNDTWNESFDLFEVNMVFNGRIIETEKFIEKLVCGRDIARQQANENNQKTDLTRRK